MSKNKDSAVTEKAYGSEPSWDAGPYHKLLQSEDPDWAIAKALNWYHLNATPKENKRWIFDYLKFTKASKADIERVKLVDLEKFKRDTNRVGFLARMAVRGAILTDNRTKRLKDGILQFIAWGAEKETKVAAKASETKRPSVHDRIKDQVSELLANLEIEIDEFVVGIGKRTLPRDWFSMEKFLKVQGIKGKQTSMIADHFRPLLEEIQEAIEKTDEQLQEGYDFLTRPQLKRFAQFVEVWITDCESHGATKRKSRKPRKKKQKSPEQLVARLKYLKESTEHKVVSVDPTKMIGADCIVIFNTKYRFLTIYRAVDQAGMTVKGTTIQSFSVEKSQERRLRAPEKILPVVVREGLRGITAVFKEVRSKDRVPKGRINKDCVIVKVL